ncbi:MAG: hypothetical protein K0S70_799 [Microbacterium sp.]|jgi:hypothetical protein|nr:hypothetical protein [Microbacterium sp.]
MKRQSTGPKTWELSAAIRDAVGLSSDQKAFLWNITSHDGHREFGTRDLVLQRTGLTDWGFRKTLTFLTDHRLIRAERRQGETTVYTINLAALKALSNANNAAAAANKATRRPVPTHAVSVATASPRRSAKTNSVAHQQSSHGGHQHQKSEPEVLTENQENRRSSASNAIRRKTQQMREKLEQGYAQFEIDEDP